MRDRAVKIRRLFYENVGPVPCYLRSFPEETQLLRDEHSRITVQVIRVILGDWGACKGLISENSYIEALVAVGQEVSRVYVRFLNRVAALTVTDLKGEDRTQSYLCGMCHAPEEFRMCCFHGLGDYPVRLPQYRQPEDRDPGSFGEDTNPAGQTQLFAHHLRQFVMGYKPQKLLEEKNYWLSLEPDGRFIVRWGEGGEEILSLSETEQRIYHYLCFLQIVEFWSALQEQCCYADTKLPLLIRGFAERLDESVDLPKLLARAEALERQTLIFQ